MDKQTTPLLRQDHFHALFPEERPFRWKQVETALFDPALKNWGDVSTLPQGVREKIAVEIPWMTATLSHLAKSSSGDTYKALLQTHDGLLFETVLMANKRGYWTICVSSQIGCAMKCTFCATGAMGLKRSLSADEITDQVRFWMAFLAERPELPQPITNVVFMGMGEPLENYEAVKKTIHTWLTYTDIGQTRITVSTVGILKTLEYLLTDPDWPPVRLAISLHSADPTRRKEIVPTTIAGFHEKLADWSHRYAKTLGNRRHYITYEYTLINEVNDTEAHAEELLAYFHKTAARMINVIPYNPIPSQKYVRSQQERIDAFKNVLRRGGVDVTQRHTMGDDIAAACGQLATVQSGIVSALNRLKA